MSDIITPQDDCAARIYVELMAEVSDRLNMVMRTQLAEFSNPFFLHLDYMAFEFAMLQLRMVAELIAFACLVAHGDVPEARSKKFREEHSAVVIFKKLALFHADYFPKPVSRVVLASGNMDIQPRPEGAITRQELQSLYTYCLKFLHRGRPAQIFAEERRKYDFDYIRESANKIAWLLDVHIINLVSGRVMLVDMNKDGKVSQEWHIPIPTPRGNAYPRA
ncbi:MAG: hypothetical protein ABI454_09455 [Sphingomicrobium sp.]